MTKFVTALFISITSLTTYAMPVLVGHGPDDNRSILNIVAASESEIAEVVEVLSHDPDAQVLVATNGHSDPLFQTLAKGIRENVKSNRRGLIISLVPSLTGSMTLVLSGHFLMASGVAGL